MATKYNHLALVRRDEVVELFKNGILYPASSLQFKGSIETLPTKATDVAKVFDKTPSIEYSINYFLVYAETEKKQDLLKQGLNIRDLVAIYPLDEEAARMGLSLMPPIRLENPIFAENYEDYQERTAVGNAKRGISNIGQIFGFDDLMKSVKKFTEKKSLPVLVSLILDESGSRQPESIWEYLISYTRSQTYPNDTRGAFLDTMSVVNNYNKGHVDFKDQKQTTTGRAILGMDRPTYRTLIDCLGASTNFIKIANKAYPDFWKIAPLYFILLDILSNTSENGAMVMGKPINEFVASVVNNYDEKYLKPALLMLGITLGQTSTYKMLYAIKKDELPFLQ